MFQRIIVPVDGSDTSNRALVTAIGLAKAFNGRVRLIHVLDEGAFMAGYDPYGYSGDLVGVMRTAGEKILKDGATAARAGGVECETMLFDTFGERLAETVAHAAKLWNADLIVVGTHGRRGFSRLMLGSGAEQIIRLAPVPVLSIRGEEEGAGATGDGKR